MQQSTYLFYKPYEVLSQFTVEVEGQRCLADYLQIESDVYAVGRLDYDSEGLLVLTNDKALKNEINGNQKWSKTYYVQIDNDITSQAIEKLRSGVTIKLPNKSLYTTKPCEAHKIAAPSLPDRIPGIRLRKNIPTSWISITIEEGKNRQIRKMCAAVGYPVLRLVRYSIGKFTIEGMQSSDCIKL